MRPRSRLAATLICAVFLAACSTPSGGTPGPGTTQAPAGTVAPQGTDTVAAGEPCSFITAAEVGAIVATTPVEVAERVGRGDCDYWLTAAKDAKVNIGVDTTPEALSNFDNTKNIGDPQTIRLGDEAYSLYNQSIGTLVVVKEGLTVIVVQVFTSDDTATQLSHATKLAEAILAGL